MKHTFDNVARIGWLLVAGALVWGITYQRPLDLALF